MGFVVAIAAGCIAFGLWNLMIAILGYFPQCQATAVGTLTKANTRRNVQVKHRVIPILTNYAYFYTVSGKQYKYKNQQYKHKRHLLPKVTLVYVKGFPRHAYPDKFTSGNEWVVGICMLLLGAMYAWIACWTA